ncbi:hypothetical protein WDU94_008660 [Cyamophila willieti]
MSTNEASYVRGVFLFFIVSNNKISFQLSLVFYCSFRVRFFFYSFLKFCDYDSCFAMVRSILDIEVPEAPDGDGQRGPKTIQ